MTQASHLDDLQQVLDYEFREPGVLCQALIHRSFAHENPQFQQSDNETLEFLGDAVLGLAVSHLLLRRFPHLNEGDLSRLRSSIVNEKELAKLALSLNLGDHLLLGKGEELTGGRQKPSLLADTLEAILAAIYLDGGLESAISVVRRLFRGYLESERDEDPLKAWDRDYKTQLQELTQARLKLTPAYVLETEEGPDHDKRFYVSVALEGQILAQGTGKSKKEAQQEAARRALEKLSTEWPLQGGGEDPGTRG
jgi:ribonuclease III